MTELRLQDLEDLKKQNEEFHLTVLTRLARMHHLLEDIQEIVLQQPRLTRMHHLLEDIQDRLSLLVTDQDLTFQKPEAKQ